MPRFEMSPHAQHQAETRLINPLEILSIVEERLAKYDDETVKNKSFAVLCGFTEQRGSLIGSNGDEIYGIVRDATITTIMLRRSNQVRTAGALRVDILVY